MTLEITANKIKNMLLKKKRRLKKNKNQETLYEGTFAITKSPDKRISNKKVKKIVKKCSRYEKPYNEKIC